MIADKIKKTLAGHNIELQYILTEKFVETIRREFGDSDPEIILDIGSRDLEQSIELRSVFPNTRIIAFEPNPNQYKLCTERAKLFNIEFIGCAISDVEGTSDFWILDINEGGSSLLKPVDVPWSSNISNKVSVPCRRIDNILEELKIDKVDCVWMDVQGYELKALQSFGKYLSEVRVMHTEASPKTYYEGHVDMDDLQNYLIENDFEIDFRPAAFHPYGEGDLICVKKAQYSKFTSIADKIYDSAKRSWHVKQYNVLVLGECDDPEYLKRYFENSKIYHIPDIDLSSEQIIDESLEKFGVYFDAIIDVASADYWSQIRLIRHSIRHLSSGGVLIIQNLLTEYIQRYSFDIWEYRHDEYIFEANFEDGSIVIIRNDLKYAKFWSKPRNYFITKETYQ